MHLRKDQQELYSLFERYLLNEMDDDKRTELEEDLLFNDELREQFNIFKTIYDVAAEEPLKATIHEMSQNSGNDLLFLKVAAVALIGFLGATFYLNSTNFDVISYMEAPSHIESDLPANMFATNYNPNPYLEEYITSVYRSDTVNISVTAPNQDLKLSSSEAPFEIDFKANVPRNLRQERLSVIIYSNSVEEYLDEKSILEAPATLDEDGSIDMKLNISLQPGLYYIVLENVQTAEPVGVRRIIVE